MPHWPLTTHTHTQHGDTALIWASMDKNPNANREVVVELIRAGARVNIANAVSQHGARADLVNTA